MTTRVQGGMIKDKLFVNVGYPAAAVQYVIALQAPFTGTISRVVLQTGSGAGEVDVEVELDGTAIEFTGGVSGTGTNTLLEDIDETAQEFVPSSANSFTAGDAITFTVSNLVSSPSVVYILMEGEET